MKNNHASNLICLKEKITILGSGGFIGSHLVEYFNKTGVEYYAPKLLNEKFFEESLGHVIYAIGVTDFNQRPYDAVEAHVCLLKKILEKKRFDSFLYLSSARIYRGLSSTLEDEPIIVQPTNKDNLYNISKLMGESLCFSTNNENVRVVRPSNIVGVNLNSNLFLPSIIRDAIKNKKIKLNSTLNSERDYICIDDVVKILPRILLEGKYKLYNIAYGKNIKSEELINKLKKITNCDLELNLCTKEYSFPEISIQRIKNEFDFKPTSIIEKFEDIVNEYKTQLTYRK